LRGLGVAALDGAGKRDGLGKWCHAELAVQDSFALVELTQRRDAITGARVNPHQGAMRRLVEWVELEPSFPEDDRPPRLLTRYEPLEYSSQLLSQGVGLGGLPLVELRAVTQREPREEIPGVRGHRIVEAIIRDQGAETANVDVDGVIESDPNALDTQLLAAQACSQRRQRSPQGASGALGVCIGPEERREAIAGLRLLSHGQVRDKSRRLPRVHLDRAPATLDARRSEELEDEAPASLPPSGGDLGAP
jgi:hypothetical protein